IKRDIADKRDDFHLFVYLVFEVQLLFQVKVPDPGIAEGANRREVRAGDMVLLRESRERGDDLVPGIKNQYSCPIQLLVLHRKILRPMKKAARTGVKIPSRGLVLSCDRF